MAGPLPSHLINLSQSGPGYLRSRILTSHDWAVEGPLCVKRVSTKMNWQRCDLGQQSTIRAPSFSSGCRSGEGTNVNHHNPFGCDI